MCARLRLDHPRQLGVRLAVAARIVAICLSPLTKDCFKSWGALLPEVDVVAFVIVNHPRYGDMRPQAVSWIA